MNTNISAEIIKITPDHAGELLKNNTINRPIFQQNVRKYSELMTNGLWGLNGETLIISSGGKLLNGQHRLLAIINAGISIEMLVVFNVNEELFDTIDTGKIRSAANVLSIKGYSKKRASMLATAAKLNISMRNFGTIEGANNYPHLVTPHLVLNEVEGDKDYAESANFLLGYKDLPLPAPSFLFLVYRMFKVDREFSTDWLHGFITGEDLGKGDYRVWVRSRLWKNEISTAKLRTTTRLYITTKAWSYAREGLIVKEKTIMDSGPGVLKYLCMEGDRRALAGGVKNRTAISRTLIK